MPIPGFYGQHSEDAKIVELLGDEAYKPDGFYIDVGAWDSNSDSVSKWFYDRGWSGINVEPVQEWFVTLERDRPRDVNLNIACSDHNGTLAFHYLAGTGLSTPRADWAKLQREEYGHQHREMVVPCMTLADICHRYVPEGKAIDFLKIDVEGHEAEVIAGGDWATYRPTIVVAEAIVAGTGAPFYEHWEPELLGYGYEFVESIESNRWYRRLG